MYLVWGIRVLMLVQTYVLMHFSSTAFHSFIIKEVWLARIHEFVVRGELMPVTSIHVLQAQASSLLDFNNSHYLYGPQIVIAKKRKH